MARTGPAEHALALSYGLTSGRSAHTKRIDTTRCVQREHGVTVDTHTANGINVGLSRRELGVSLICLETALSAKFAAAIRETLEHVPEVPPGYEGQEQRLRRAAVMDADVESINSYIAARR